MKYFLLISVIVACLINMINTFEYRDYNYEDLYSKKIHYDLRNAPELFEKFIRDYKKQYKDEADYNKHYQNFVNNLNEINKLNDKGGSASFDINMFADLTESEINMGGGFQ